MDNYFTTCPNCGHTIDLEPFLDARSYARKARRLAKRLARERKELDALRRIRDRMAEHGAGVGNSRSADFADDIDRMYRLFKSRHDDEVGSLDDPFGDMFRLINEADDLDDDD